MTLTEMSRPPTRGGRAEVVGLWREQGAAGPPCVRPPVKDADDIVGCDGRGMCREVSRRATNLESVVEF